MASQNKANPSPVASSAKNPFSKPSLSPTSKKQPNILWMDLSSKLASNDKLTSNEHKKHLKNNLCLYCSAEDYKLNSCSKKQTMVSSKGCGASVAASEKSLEKWRATMESNLQDSAQTEGHVETFLCSNKSNPTQCIHSLFLLLFS